MQTEIRMLAPVRGMSCAADDLINRAQSMQGAIQLCIALSGLTNDAICERLGIDRGHFSNIVRGRGNLPPNKLVPLMELCGNYAPLQYLARSCGFELFKDAKQQRKAELLAELAMLEGAA